MARGRELERMSNSSTDSSNNDHLRLQRVSRPEVLVGILAESFLVSFTDYSFDTSGRNPLTQLG